MNQKQVLVLIMIIVSICIILLGGFFILYKYSPTTLGLPPHYDPSDSLKYKQNYDPLVQVSMRELEKYQKNLVYINSLKNEKEYLINYSKNLLDSINKMQKNVWQTQNDGLKFQDSLNKTIKKMAALRDSLTSAYNLINLNQNELKAFKGEDNKSGFTAKQRDSITKVHNQDFAKIYDNSNPIDVAKILQTLDDQNASKILKLMSKKKAGKVIEAMDPKKGASILLNGKEN